MNYGDSSGSGGYERRTRIATPEGLELELSLAGVGSRAAAWLLDTLLQLLAITVIEIVLVSAVGDSLPGALVAVVGSIAAFAVIWGYHVAFETLRAGQTPGKRRLGIRVLDAEGGPVGLPQAAVRNLVRVVDEGLTLFLGALISIVRSRRNQRIGDHAAGTIVVYDAPRGSEQGPAQLLLTEATWRVVEQASSWDTTRLRSEDVVAARQFLLRRDGLAADKRTALAERLAASLRARVAGADPELPPERFIEALAALIETRR